MKFVCSAFQAYDAELIIVNYELSHVHCIHTHSDWTQNNDAQPVAVS